METSMKTAICLSGAIKYPENSINTIKKLKEHNDCCVFIHTWDLENLEDFLNNSATSQNKDGKFIVIHNAAEYLDFNIETFKATSIITEKFDTHKFEDYLNNYPFERVAQSVKGIGILSMFYSLQKSNEIKTIYENSNSMTFDCVVRMRFDTDLCSELNLSDFDMEKCNIPEGNDHGGTNDRFAFGGSKIMDSYSSIFDTIPNIDRSYYHPEKIAKLCFEFHQIPLNRPAIDVRINNAQS
jgi:hypothetical protein